MNSVAALVAALAGGDPGEGTPRARRLLVRFAWGITVVALFALIFGLALAALVTSWQTGDWVNFNISVILPAMLLFFALILVPALLLNPAVRAGLSPALSSAPAKEQVREGAKALREIAALGDDRLTPVTVLQPAALTSGELPIGPTEIGPLKQPAFAATSGRAATTSALLSPLVVLIAVGAFAALMFGVSSGTSSDALMALIFPLLFVLAITVAIVMVVVRQRQLQTSVTATADEEGVSWQQRGLPGRAGRTGTLSKRLRWDQVRSLSRIVYVGVPTTATSTATTELGQRTAYVLDTPDATLVWTVPPLPSARDLAAAELLLRLAITRTRQPLRDLSAMATELVQAGPSATRVLAGRGAAGSSTPLLQGLPLRLADAKPRRRRAKIALWVSAALIPVLLLAGLYATGFWLEHYQSQYYANLATNLHSGQPLYHDDLTQPDGDWPVNQSTSTDYHGYGYVPGGYQLSGKEAGHFLIATTPHQFGDAAIEVTATQTGELTENSGDGVGLVVHANASGDEFLVFTVAYNGYWTFMHYKYVDDRASDNWNWIDDGRSNAIYNFPGGINHLLLISHGNQYLFYINGQFVGSENVRYETIPSSGYAGVYLDDTALTGTFSDFSVYPVQLASLWDVLKAQVP